MKILRIIAMLLIAALLFGCVDTPDSLKESRTEPSDNNTAVLSLEDYEDSASAENTSAKVNETVERGSLEAIRNQLESDLKKTYKNIKITKAHVSDADAMPIWNIKIGMNPDYDYTPLLELFYSDRYDVADEKYYRHTKAGTSMTEGEPLRNEPEYSNELGQVILRNRADIDIDGFAPIYDDGDKTLSVFTYSTGGVWGSQTGGGLESDAVYYYNNFEIYKEYDLRDENPSTDEEYTMADGEKWSVSDAINFVENFWEEYIAPSDTDDFTYKVKKLYIMDLGDGKYGYLFDMQMSDKDGNFYDSDNSEFYFSNAAILAGEPFPFPDELSTYCAQKEKITRFTKDFGFELCDEPVGESLLSLGEASQILSETLAPNIGLELEAELCYSIFCKGYHCADGWIKKDFYAFLCQTESDFEIRPIWCFKPAGESYLLDPFMGRYYVDAVTGEVSILINMTYMKDGEASGW